MAKLKDVIGGSSGLEEGLEKAKELLKKVKATLKDAERRTIRDEGLLLWLGDLRNLALEIEDLDDLFQYQILAMEAEESMEAVPISNVAQSGAMEAEGQIVSTVEPTIRGGTADDSLPPISRLFPLKAVYYYFLRCFHRDDDNDDDDVDDEEEEEVRLSHASSSPHDLDHPFFLKEMLDRLNKIQERSDDIAKQKDALHFPIISGQPSHYVDADSSSIDRQTGSLSMNPDKFVGRDKQEKEILDKLIGCDVKPMVEVLALMGMDGIDKTSTLCRHIYDHPHIQAEFDLRGWVHVGEAFHVSAVTKGILDSFTKRRGKKRDKYESPSVVLQKLMEQVHGKRFLLVMDDVWCDDIGKWNRVLAPLVCGESWGSKIFVTTRYLKVAEAARASKVVIIERAAASSPSRKKKEMYSHSDDVDDDDDDEVRLSHASSSPRDLDHPSFLKQMLDRLNKIQVRFDDIAKQKEALHFPIISGQPSRYVDAESSFMDRRTGSLPVNPGKFVGRDEQKKEISDKLIGCDANPMPEVLALVGMGGIGKTTLCQHIYNDSRIRKHFDLMGWVHVGESFDVLLVANNILNSFTKGNDKYEQGSTVEEKIMAQVQRKRFLLVMDDVWCQNLGDWETVLVPFSNNVRVKKGCKILVTTRDRQVAQAAGDLNPSRLDCLSQEDGWCLFRNYACNRILDGHDDSHELVHIGKGIVEKCNGLPLAIKVMGSLMKNRGDDVDSWREILESDFSNIKEGRREILGPLYLSYLHLPSHLKACFKFFSFIPKRQKGSLKDYCGKLVDLWLAHNLVGDEGNCSFAEQGYKFIGEFQSRSFLERVTEETTNLRFNYPPPVQQVRVHDLIFDLAQFVSNQEICKTDPCEIVGIFLLSFSKKHTSWAPPTNARNLTIYTPNIFFVLYVLPTLQLEESNFFSSSDLYPKLRYLHVVWARIQQFHFKHLRVLCIDHSDLEEIPDSLYMLFNLRKLEFIECNGIRRVSDLIGNLKNLRSLSFSDCRRLEIIPESASNLTVLEELKLYGCRSLKKLPDDLIIRLANLRCLDLQNTGIKCLPVGLSNLRKLRHLPYYPFSSGEFRDQLNHLNGLNLKGDTLSIELHVSSLHIKESSKESEMGIKGQQLRFLRILFPPFPSEYMEEHEKMLQYLKPPIVIRKLYIESYHGSRFPFWMGDRSFHQLVYLYLSTFNWCKTLSPLQQLPSLEKLRIEYFKCLEKLVSDDDWGLIRIENIPYSEQKLCFPKLHDLLVVHCGSMKLLDVYRLTALQRLDISFCANLESIEFVDQTSSTKGLQDRSNPSLVLSELKLYFCHQLCFSNNNNVTPPQSLEQIDIASCPKLVDWCQSNPNSKWTDIINVRQRYF